MLTRRSLLKRAAFSAGALMRVDHGPFEVMAQAVSAARLSNDGALVRQHWPRLAIGDRRGRADLEVDVADDL
jgi:hypothetical protein